jgi:hypothetical protein
VVFLSVGLPVGALTALLLLVALLCGSVALLVVRDPLLAGVTVVVL